MKLGDYKGLKLTLLDFSGKFSFGQNLAKRAQIGPRIDIFNVSLEMAHLFFLIFCMKLGDYKGIKVT